MKVRNTTSHHIGLTGGPGDPVPLFDVTPGLNDNVDRTKWDKARKNKVTQAMIDTGMLVPVDEAAAAPRGDDRKADEKRERVQREG